MVFNDMVATLDQFAAAVDPNIAPLTYAALQALKTFVRIGGTLRAYSETPRELGVDTTDRAFINVFDDFEIIVQHTPPH